MTDATDILVPSEICTLLRITRAKFYYLAGRGRLGFLFKVGNEWRARRRDLDLWITQNTAAVVAASGSIVTMANETELEPVSIDEVQAFISDEGLEVDVESEDVLRIRDHESGLVLRAVLADNILYFAVSCLVVKEDAISPALMRQMLGADNGISTSYFQLYPHDGGTVAITLNNFCKLQQMGHDDRDDIVSCLQFLMLDVVTASELLGELTA